MSKEADGCAEGATKHEVPSAMSIHKHLCINTKSISNAEGATYFAAPSALRPKRHSLQEDPKAISSDFMLRLPLHHYSGYYFDH